MPVNKCCNWVWEVAILTLLLALLLLLTTIALVCNVVAQLLQTIGRFELPFSCIP